MKRLLLFLLLASSAYGQGTYPVTNTNGGNVTSTNAACVPTACVGIGVISTAQSMSVAVSGTFVATLLVEQSSDGQTFSTTATLSSTGTTTYSASGLVYMRVRASAYTSGNAGVTLTSSSTPVSGGTISGLTAGQVGIAGSATSITSSKALQGTDASVMTAGTVSGTAAALCTDANGGATTSGCTSAGAPTNATYVLGTANGSLTNATVFFDLVNSPDVPPASANALDDEMNAAAGGVNTGLWTWVNQGGTTANYSGTGYLDMHAPASASTNLRILVQTLPAAPYTFKTKLECGGIAADFLECGLVLRESATGKACVLGVVLSTPGINTGTKLQINCYSNNTTFANTRYNSGTVLSFISGGYFQINRTSTTLTYLYCTLGMGCVTLYSSTLTADFTTAPDQIGLDADSQNASNAVDAFVWWFRRTL